MLGGDVKRRSSYLAIKLVLISSLMFGFGYALVPLYSYLCDITGLGGKANNNVQVDVSKLETGVIDESREVVIEFIANNYSMDKWGFTPEVNQIIVHPGEFVQTNFVATNKTDAPRINKSSYNLAPAESSLYFQKIQCFCFTEQKFNAKESRIMPIIFRLDPDIPDKIKTITLAYQINDQSS